MDILSQTTDGQLIKISPASLETLRSEIHGEIITPQDKDYDTVRAVWNGMIDKRPSLIVRCSGTADVIRAVRFAKEHNLLISVRAAGHNIAGRALGNEIFLIDLSKLRYVHVDPDEETVTVSPGATLADLDHETQHYGLAVPVGINSTTGVAGLTLGGGFGWLSRKCGLTIDNLISAEVVTVDGERIICSEKSHPDLFWGIRGGGGNFGIVTSFKFKLHKVGPTVMCGPVVFPLEEAKGVYHRFLEFCKNAPEEATVWSVLRPCPPFPFVDAAYIGKPVLILVGMYNGPLEEGKKVLSQLKLMGKPIGDGLFPQQFVNFQKAFDPLLVPGVRNYWKTHNFKEIDKGLVDVLIAYGSKLPSPHTELFFTQMGGQTNRIGKNKTAYPHRDVDFILNVHTRWDTKSDDQICIAWAREFFEKVKPFSSGGSYVNFVSEGDDSLKGAYLENTERLAALKTKYDPKNVLRSNLNISPHSI